MPPASLTDIRSAIDRAIQFYERLRCLVESGHPLQEREMASLWATLDLCDELFSRLSGGPIRSWTSSPAVTSPPETDTMGRERLFDAFIAIEQAQCRLREEIWRRRPLVAACRRERRRLATVCLVIILVLVLTPVCYTRIENALCMRLIANANTPPGVTKLLGLDDIECNAAGEAWRWTLGQSLTVFFDTSEALPMQCALRINNRWPDQTVTVVHNGTETLSKSILPVNAETDPGMPLSVHFVASPGPNSITLTLTNWNGRNGEPVINDSRQLGVRLSRLDVIQDNPAGWIKAYLTTRKEGPRR